MFGKCTVRLLIVEDSLLQVFGCYFFLLVLCLYLLVCCFFVLFCFSAHFYFESPQRFHPCKNSLTRSPRGGRSWNVKRIFQQCGLIDPLSGGDEWGKGGGWRRGLCVLGGGGGEGSPEEEGVETWNAPSHSVVLEPLRGQLEEPFLVGPPLSVVKMRRVLSARPVSCRVRLTLPIASSIAATMPQWTRRARSCTCAQWFCRGAVQKSLIKCHLG